MLYVLVLLLSPNKRFFFQGWMVWASNYKFNTATMIVLKYHYLSDVPLKSKRFTLSQQYKSIKVKVQ